MTRILKKLELRELWRGRVDRQRQSGLTVSEFCRREGVSTATFYGWKRKLRGTSRPNANRLADRGRTRARGPAVGSMSRALSEPAFVQLPLSSTARSPWIELALVEGTIIRVPQHNLAALQTILGALHGASRSSSIGEAPHA
jgi:hypothetical protein